MSSSPWGGGDNPLAIGLVADSETILLQLGEGEKIGDSIVHKPWVKEVLVPAFLGSKILFQHCSPHRG